MKDCLTCDTCEDTLEGLNSKLISIVDKRLYNIRYELNRPVDYALARLLSFYKPILSDICNGTDCDCYTIPENVVPVTTSATLLSKENIIEHIKILIA